CAMLLALLVVFQPLFLVNACRVANDSLAILLATVVFVLLVSLRPSGLQLRAAIVGVVLGVAIMTKATNLTLAPLVPIPLAHLAARRECLWRRAAVACIVATAIAIAISARYFCFNWAHYRHLIPAQEVLMNARRAGSSSDLLTAASQIHWPQE